MALYHLTAKTGTRAGGVSALAKAQYIQREAGYARVPDAVAYARSGNLPSFAGGSAAAYWDAADVYERANGRLFKEVEFALPLELGAAEQRELADSFVEDLLAGETLPYTLAIHEGRGRNPHCHVLVSERVNDGVEREASQWFRRWNPSEPDLGGARKTEALKPREWLDHIREKWAELVNRALERAGVRERVDHRSLEAQGIEREPQIHLGPNVVRMEERGLRTERADQVLRIEERNAELERARARQPGIDRTQERDDRERPGPNPSRPQDEDAAPAGRDDVRSRGRAGRDEDLEPERVRGRSAPGPELESDTGNSDAPAARQRAVEERAAAARGTAEHARSQPAGDEPDALDAGDQLHSGRGSSRDPRERDRAELHEREQAPAGPGHRGRGALPGHDREGAGPDGQAHGLDSTDRTAQAVERQLGAMGCERYELAIRDSHTGHVLERCWSADEVREHLPWLQHMNARGSDILIRPEPEHARGLVLVKDLSPAGLAQLERDARGPALVVETSRETYQAWIRVPGRASEAERDEIGRRLGREYDAEHASYGRLAGFANRQEEHRDRGRERDQDRGDLPSPFTLVRSASGRPAQDGELLLRQATRAVREQTSTTSRERTQPSPPRPSLGQNAERATELFRSRFEEVSRIVNDPNRCDFNAAVTLAERGYDRRTIEHAIRAGSPDLEERRGRHLDDYVHWTVRHALSYHARMQERERSGPDRDNEMER